MCVCMCVCVVLFLVVLVVVRSPLGIGFPAVGSVPMISSFMRVSPGLMSREGSLMALLGTITYRTFHARTTRDEAADEQMIQIL